MEKSQPTLKAPHSWLIQTRVMAADGGASAKALDYTLKRWPALVRYANTGHLPIDNNAVENCIRPIAIGKEIGCSPAMSGQANELQLFKRFLVRLNSMVLTLPPD